MDIEEKIQSKIGYGISVDATGSENHNKDGYYRIQITDLNKRAKSELQRCENQGIEIDGSRRDVELLRDARGDLLSELGAEVVMFVEEPTNDSIYY